MGPVATKGALMTRPDQPAPGKDTAESGQDTAQIEGGGESGDVDPREPTEDASELSSSTAHDEGPKPLEPPD